MRKKRVLCGMMALMMATLAGCASSGSGAPAETKAAANGEAAGATGDTYKIRVAHVCGSGAPFDYGAQEFKKIIEEKSGGRITVEVFAGDMTTDEVEGVEMVQNNNLEIMWASTGSLGGFVPELGVFELPFLFSDLEHVEAALGGDFGKTIMEKVSAVNGITAIAFHEDGWRNILTKDKVINSVEDMKGIRMRSMMNEVCVAMYEALGATPISLASGEIFTSLQNGVVDGQDNSVLYAKADGYIEAINSICDIHHFYSSGLVICSTTWFDGLSPEDQELIKTSAQEAGAAQRAWFLNADESLIKEYEGKGYTVTRPTDIDAWVSAVQPVYDKMLTAHPEWKELVQMVNDAKKQ